MSDMQRQRARIRWRARRGLLENDLIITRFLDEHEQSLSDEQVTGLLELLELDDNTLLEILLGKAEPQDEYNTPVIRNLVNVMRQTD